MAEEKKSDKKLEEKIATLEEKYSNLAKQTENLTNRFINQSQNMSDLVTIMEAQARIFKQLIKN